MWSASSCEFNGVPLSHLPSYCRPSGGWAEHHCPIVTCVSLCTINQLLLALSREEFEPTAPVLRLHAQLLPRGPNSLPKLPTPLSFAWDSRASSMIGRHSPEKTMPPSQFRSSTTATGPSCCFSPGRSDICLSTTEVKSLSRFLVSNNRLLMTYALSLLV